MGRRLAVSMPEPIGTDAAGRSPLAHQPEALAAFNHLYGTLWSRGVLDQKTKETARIRNARVIGCSICRNLRFAGARAEGLDEAQIELIRDDYEESALGDAQKAVLRFTDAFLFAPSAVPDEVREALRKHFSPEQIVELAAALALFMGFSKIAIALGGLPETMPVVVVPTPEP
jgi:AhpD family alkylhydroperoxidase